MSSSDITLIHAQNQHVRAIIEGRNDKAAQVYHHQTPLLTSMKGDFTMATSDRTDSPIQIQLSQGSVALIDASDAPLVAGYVWYLTPNGYVGAMTTCNGKRKLLLLHRLITGEPARPSHVDHINGNKLDNRRVNLRVVTPQINQVNRKRTNRNNGTGERGVSYLPRTSASKPWRAQISVNGRSHHLGLFATRSEAVEARRTAEHEYFGEECPR